jgi:hypothetical protein
MWSDKEGEMSQQAGARALPSVLSGRKAFVVGVVNVPARVPISSGMTCTVVVEAPPGISATLTAYDGIHETL